MIPNVPILAAVDDFLFRSKIRATAKHVNAEIVFAQTPDEILAQARALKPSLVIIDLNSPKADAVNTFASLKADPNLAGIRAIGFASHVHADLIAAARSAGADQVLPRSAFAGSLAEILASATAP
jgi:DNA-binding NarL/FixJ family response regulator